MPFAGLDSLCVELPEEPPQGCGDTGGGCSELSKSSSSPFAALPTSISTFLPFPTSSPFPPPPLLLTFLLSAAEQELNKTSEHKFELTGKAHPPETSSIPSPF